MAGALAHTVGILDNSLIDVPKTLHSDTLCGKCQKMGKSDAMCWIRYDKADRKNEAGSRN